MSFFGSLSRREKTLVFLMVFVALPLGLWALVAVPLQDARDRAIGALAGAQTDYVWVAEQVGAFANTGARATPQMSEPVGIAGLETALIDAGLRGAVMALEAGQDRGIRLQLSDVSFNALGRFLDRVDQELGYTIGALRITPVGEAGQVDAGIGLEPR